MLPNGKDDTDLMRLGKELQASLMRNDKLEKENHELRQEVARLRAQVSNLKAHDNERKSMLWKKLQSSYDGNNTEGSNLKATESVKSNIKVQDVKNQNPKPTVQGQSTAVNRHRHLHHFHQKQHLEKDLCDVLQKL
ncbi:INCREASED PETAL GROWTH ANISOTROPY 1-like protein 1 [Cardamine amara subsp. amara]|uniref:INCREASED PETAL GROWTH ANISOTROPY 1-like protein 1 n=1 Tax=Cardamine amara subsp. amara TaxID=228776 RepID=A0ABD1AKM5_CARAN